MDIFLNFFDSSSILKQSRTASFYILLLHGELMERGYVLLFPNGIVIAEL
jgi:hypothetical protein